MISRYDIRSSLRAFGTLAVVLCTLTGCRSYTDKTGRALSLFESGRFAESQALFESRKVTGSTFLSGAEGGLVALTGGDLEGAIANLTKAADFAVEVEDQALLDPTALAQNLTSMVINEAMADYKGEGYERVMVHACLGLAYLAKGSIDDLLVEVRRANDLLVAEEKLYETEYQAGGFGHMLSAIGYELRGEFDEAYIDYLALYEKRLGLPLVGPALVRLSQRLYRNDDHDRFVAEFGEAPEIPADAAHIVLLAGIGMGPQKVETRLDVPTGDGIYSWAVPAFVQRPQYVAGVEVRAGDLAAESVVLEDVGAVAEKNLNDRMLYLSVRSAVRTVLKNKLADQIRKDHGQGAYALAQIFALVTERADLRSWVTLPATWQAARLHPRPGRMDLEVAAQGGETVHLGTYELAPGETVFLLVRTIGPRTFAQVIGGHQVLEPAVQAPAETGNPTLTNP